jgi:DUF1365 family protein
MTAALYVGETTHHRLGAVKHRFRYSLFQVLVDPDRLDQDLRGLKLLRRGRFGLFSLDDRDHGWRDGRPLRGWVETRLAEAGVAATACRIRLLTFPRVLGFVFNPVSLVYVEDAAGNLEAVIYEVNSTFGQTHAYVAPANGRGRQRQVADKRLFVSPFYGVDGSYRFDVTPPDDRLDLSIVKTSGGRPDFTATLALRRRPLNDLALLGVFLAMPLMTLKVVAAIHWEALRLFLKGVALAPRPPSPDVGVSRATLTSRATGKNDVNLCGKERSADVVHGPDAGCERTADGLARLETGARRPADGHSHLR